MELGELVAIGALTDGWRRTHFADPEGLRKAVKGGKKHRRGTDIMQGLGGQTYLAIVSPGALEPGNQQNVGSLGLDHPSRDDVEGQNDRRPLHRHGRLKG